MVQAVVARQRGDDYQARHFWLEAARLLDPNSCVARVVFEKGPKGFDDLVVHYERQRPVLDAFGQPVLVDFYQYKWHVSAAGTIGFKDLIDPAFINASTTSFLQNVRAAQLAHATDGTGARFSLVTNWRYHPDDQLRLLFSKAADQFDVNALYEGKTDRSKMGRVRKAWREHLGFANDDELRPVVRPMRICEKPDSLEALRDHVNARLQAVGIRTIEDDRTGFAYDDLVRKLQAQGRADFTRESFRDMCRKEGLLSDTGGARRGRPDGVLTVGIRSFMRFGENMEDQVDRMLSLVHHFRGRYIAEEAAWHAKVLPEVKSFVSSALPAADRIQLQLDAHASVAFAVGTLVDAKAGKAIDLLQRGVRGTRIWSSTDNPDADVAAAPGLSFAAEEVAPGGQDLALAIGLTHSVAEDVRTYIARELSGAIGTLLVCEPAAGGPSQAALQNGGQAWRWAEDLVRHVRRSAPGGLRRVHVFAACPNAFLFFLGQQVRAIGGSCVLYEFDFDGQQSGSYRPALTF